jgi:hypothetical protein
VGISIWGVLGRLGSGAYSHEVVVFHERLLVAGEEAQEGEDEGCGAAYCWDKSCETHRGVSMGCRLCAACDEYDILRYRQQDQTKSGNATNLTDEGDQSFTYTTRARTEDANLGTRTMHTRPFTSVDRAVLNKHQNLPDSQPRDHPPGLPALVKTSSRVDVLSPTCYDDPCCDDAYGRDSELSERLLQGSEEVRTGRHQILLHKIIEMPRRFRNRRQNATRMRWG